MKTDADPVAMYSERRLYGHREPARGLPGIAAADGGISPTKGCPLVCN